MFSGNSLCGLTKHWNVGRIEPSVHLCIVVGLFHGVLNGLLCADVPLRNYSLTHSWCSDVMLNVGKLQTLDVLLRRMKVESHRALIFTQMTKMLDVLESFLSFHGHRYLRLDGTTKVHCHLI